MKPAQHFWRVVCPDNIDRIGESFPTHRHALSAMVWRHICFGSHRVIRQG